MRYSSKHKASTRAHLLAATGALAKKNGFSATGVDGFMAAAGLTSGAFYSHFGSKKALLEAIVGNELQRSTGLFSINSADQLMAVVEAYLSPSHVENPESGCVVPALTAEIARAGESTQRIFECGMVELKHQFKNGAVDDARAWSILALLVGTVMIARALPAGQTRNELLEGVMVQIRHLVDDGG